MKIRREASKTTEWMAPLVFAMFGVCLLFVLLCGARVYRGLTKRDEDAYLLRTACQYVTTRVRQADTADAVSVEAFDGVETLVLREEQSGEAYLTRVYCWDGMLRELYSVADGAFSPADGEIVCEAEELRFSMEDGCLTVWLQVRGETRELMLTLRSTGGAHAE